MTRRSLRQRLAGDRRGTALIEFSAVLPVLLVMWLGTMQLQDGIACNRKVTVATRATADLIAQNVSGSTTAAEVDSSLAAVTQVLAPFAADRAQIRITQVATDWAGRTTVQWSRGRNVAAIAKGQNAVIPVAMRIPGTYFLFAEITYAYQPPMNFGFIGPLTLRDSLYMLPRNSSRIDCGDC